MHSQHSRVHLELDDINSPEKLTKESVQGRTISYVERKAKLNFIKTSWKYN